VLVEMLICTVVAELPTVVLMALEDTHSSVVVLLGVTRVVVTILETTKVDPLLDQVVLTDGSVPTSDQKENTVW
tara:strand:- start:2840 stop:3061 length:222 start_codon:yes stop_codon:yes gene_type:complete